MVKLFIIVLLVFSLGCSKKKYYQPWIVNKKDCFNGVLIDQIYLMSQHEQSLASFQIGKIPDTGRGPIQYLYFDSGSERYLIDGENPGFDYKMSYAKQANDQVCVLDLVKSCLNYEKMYKEITSLNIPIGVGFEEPADRIILHGTKYFISVRDGEGNTSSWNHYASDHPLKTVIDKIFNQVESCVVNESD